MTEVLVDVNELTPEQLKAVCNRYVDLVANLKELVLETPNDMELGYKVRQTLI